MRARACVIVFSFPFRWCCRRFHFAHIIHVSLCSICSNYIIHHNTCAMCMRTNSSSTSSFRALSFFLRVFFLSFFLFFFFNNSYSSRLLGGLYALPLLLLLPPVLVSPLYELDRVACLSMCWYALAFGLASLAALICVRFVHGPDRQTHAVGRGVR